MVAPFIFLATSACSKELNLQTNWKPISSKDQKLFDALRSGSLKRVKAALDAKANPNAIEANGWTPLLDLNRGEKSDERFEIAKLLISKGAKVNYRQPDQGWTPLTNALNYRNGSAKLVQLLLSKGADPNLTMNDGTSALHFAVRNGDVEIVKMLLAKGAKVSAKIRDRSPELPKEFLDEIQEQENPFQFYEKGYKPLSGITPLHKLMEMIPYEHDKFVKVLNLLIGAGAKINEVDDNGWTLLHHLSTDPLFSAEAISSIVAKGGNINAQSKGGWTPLHVALLPKFYYWRPQSSKSIKALIASGARLDIKNTEQQSPIDVLRTVTAQQLRILLYDPQLALSQEEIESFLSFSNKLVTELDPSGPVIEMPLPEQDEFGRQYKSIKIGSVRLERSVRIDGEEAVLTLRYQPLKKAVKYSIREFKLQEVDVPQKTPFEISFPTNKAGVLEFRFPKLAADGGALNIAWEEVMTDGFSSGSFYEGRGNSPVFSTNIDEKSEKLLLPGITISHNIPNRTMEFVLDSAKGGSAREKTLVGKSIFIEYNKPFPVFDTFEKDMVIKFRFRYLPNTKWISGQMNFEK